MSNFPQFLGGENKVGPGRPVSIAAQSDAGLPALIVEGALGRVVGEGRNPTAVAHCREQIAEPANWPAKCF